MTHSLTLPRAMGGAICAITALVGAGALLPVTTTNPIAQAIQTALVIVGCVIALFVMGVIDMIRPTNDVIKTAKDQLAGIFIPIAIATVIALAIRFITNAPSAITTLTTIPYYITYYLKVSVFEETLFRGAVLLALTHWCDKRDAGYMPAIVISTIIFIIPHFQAYYLTSIGNMIIGIAQFAAVAMVGYCTAVMTIKTDNLIAAIVLHFGTDFLLAIAVGAYIAGVNRPFSSGYDVICAIVINIVTALVLIRWRQKNRCPNDAPEEDAR